ncbi:VOC family protein [Rhodococcus rhodochrous]|uniref:VOC family protein n=1 Tax=Rhodococcus rhodochrous TaxID=1829 RepID=UPI000379C0D7|nr:VOC family protein [Rhodococcus rhodochrous]
MSTSYDVGGVQLQRPFRIQRLGHFGYNVDDVDRAVDFYEDTLGFARTDVLDLRDTPVGRRFADDVDSRLIFTRFGSDHHAFILMNKAAAGFMGGGGAPDLTTNQITWQVSTLREVVDASEYLIEAGVPIVRVGRDMPGGNWHVYFVDPDGHVVELTYGMEQVGWSGHSRPREMHDRAFHRKPELPQMSEPDEIREAQSRGTDLASGFRYEAGDGERFDVGGALLPRPFSITGLGPVGIFSRDTEAALAFYASLLGMQVTEEASVLGHPVWFLRAGHEHHSLVIAPIELRDALGWDDNTTSIMLGVQVGSYEQLRAARRHLEERGCKEVQFPRELHTGIDYAAHYLDPAGHRIQLYYAMEHVGWDGSPRPADRRPLVEEPWPEVIESDLFGEPFMGPLW